MEQPNTAWASLVRGAVLISMAAGLGMGQPAAAQSSPVAEVSLVRQDFSDCTNANVDPNSPDIGGTAWVVRNPDGTTGVKVGMTASPDTTYHFYLKCVRQIGDVVTGDEGTGVATFDFPTNIAGNVFAFDVYPDGAPLGNKFQSVQVQMQ